jgi:hypothetical protein
MRISISRITSGFYHLMIDTYQIFGNFKDGYSDLLQLEDLLSLCFHDKSTPSIHVEFILYCAEV